MSLNPSACWTPVAIWSPHPSVDFVLWHMLARIRAWGTLCHCGWEWTFLQPLWKPILQFLRTAGVDPPKNPCIQLHNWLETSLELLRRAREPLEMRTPYWSHVTFWCLAYCGLLLFFLFFQQQVANQSVGQESTRNLGLLVWELVLFF